MLDRKSFDLQTYTETIQTAPCFICQFLADNNVNFHHIIYENEEAVVFLNKYPVLYGYVLVAPKAHKEQVTGDFTRQEYLNLQALIHAVAEAVRKQMKPERIYILSLGSQQANTHVHWHIAPLPAGIPFEDQQLNALRFGNGVLDLTDNEMAQLADELRVELKSLGYR